VFLRGLEQALRETLLAFGIEGHTIGGRTGIWVGSEKIASIGVAVRRWVSYHGFALNVSPDLRFFDLIHPCGLEGVRMTSMKRLLGDAAPPLAEVRQEAARSVARQFGFGGLEWVEPEAARAFLQSPQPADGGRAHANPPVAGIGWPGGVPS